MSFLQLRSGFFKNYPHQPYVTTQAASGVDADSAEGNGTVVNTGGSVLTARGFVYSATDTAPSLDDTVVVEGGTSTGAFTATIGSLSGATTYYYRAYATNAFGTGYGEVLQFSTSSASTYFNFIGPSGYF